MPQDDTNEEFRNDLTDAEWETVAKMLMDYCRKNLLPYLRSRMRQENSSDAEDLLISVVEEALKGLMAGTPTFFSKPPVGETRKQMVQSLHAMCLGNEPQPMPKWLTNKVYVVAKVRVTDFSRRAYKRSTSGAEAFEVAADPIDEHAAPDEDAARREELEWQRSQVANAATRIFRGENQRLVSEWLHHLHQDTEDEFLRQLPERDKHRLRKARGRLQENLKHPLYITVFGSPGSGKSSLVQSLIAAKNASRPETGPAPENIHFTVTSPDALPAGSASIVDVWVHLASQQGKVLSLAAKVRDARPKIAGSKGPVPLARGTHLAIQLNVPGCEVRPVEDTVFWSGEIANATFAVTVPKGTRPGTLASEAVVRVHGLSIARIAFVLTSGTRRGTPGVVNARVKRHRRAFASYASKDRDAVLGRIQGMQKETRDLDVFVDVARLKSGQHWPEKLREEILSRDVLYLFWSKAASESEWVEKEWRIAYTERGVTFIDPVPLEPPDVVRPPKELAELHFNDWVLAFVRGQSATSVKKTAKR